MQPCCSNNIFNILFQSLPLMPLVLIAASRKFRLMFKFGMTILNNTYRAYCQTK